MPLTPLAFIEHLVTDMGNGAALCGACGECLGSDPRVTNDFTECPKCKAEFIGESTWVSPGGPDF
jgi:predicted Zn-ribbon and HTH transcriptional regulator